MNHAARVVKVLPAITLIAVVFGLALSSRDAQAVQLPLTKIPPDIYSCGILVQYDADTNLLSAVGTAGTLDLDGGATADYNILDGTFELSASIDETGTASSGMLAIGGTIAELGADSGWLLTGTLMLFGYPETPGAETLDFYFEVTESDLADYYGGGGGGGHVGVWLHDTGFAGTFASSFDNDEYGIGFGMGAADAFYPEPSMTVLILGAVVVLLLRQRRHAARRFS